MYHPAAALYNPNLKETLIKDFKKLEEFLTNLKRNKKVKSKKKEEIKEILNL
jgi:hypothetical protein